MQTEFTDFIVLIPNLQNPQNNWLFFHAASGELMGSCASVFNTNDHLPTKISLSSPTEDNIPGYKQEFEVTVQFPEKPNIRTRTLLASRDNPLKNMDTFRRTFAPAAFIESPKLVQKEKLIPTTCLIQVKKNRLTSYILWNSERYIPVGWSKVDALSDQVLIAANKSTSIWQRLSHLGSNFGPTPTLPPKRVMPQEITEIKNLLEPKVEVNIRGQVLATRPRVQSQPSAEESIS